MKPSLIAAAAAASLLTLQAAAFAQAAPGGLTRAEVRAELERARAAGEIRPWNDDVYPPRENAARSTVTRAQVQAELDAARASGELARLQRETWLPETAAPTGQAKTRAQVRAETAEARRLGLLRGSGDGVPLIATPQQNAQIEAAGLRARGEAVSAAR